MKPGLLLACVFSGGVAFLTAAAPATAESPTLPCGSPARLWPRDGQNLPADAPALVFGLARTQSSRTFDDHMVEIRGADGQVVPYAAVADGSDPSLYLLRFAAPMQVGDLQIRYVDFCSNAATGLFASATLHVVPSPGVPTSIGTATSVASARFVGGLDPGVFPAEVYFQVIVQLTPVMAAYKSVTDWSVSYPGGPGPAPGVHGYDYGDYGPDSLTYTIVGVCGAGQDYVTAPVTIAAHVAGTDASRDPPAITLNASARCPVSPPTCGPDGGAQQVDAGADIYIYDAAPTTVDASAAVVDTRMRLLSNGCSIGGSAWASAWTPLVLIGLAFVLVHRRRSGNPLRRKSD